MKSVAANKPSYVDDGHIYESVETYSHTLPGNTRHTTAPTIPAEHSSARYASASIAAADHSYHGNSPASPVMGPLSTATSTCLSSSLGPPQGGVPSASGESSQDMTVPSHQQSNFSTANTAMTSTSYAHQIAVSPFDNHLAFESGNNEQQPQQSHMNKLTPVSLPAEQRELVEEEKASEIVSTLDALQLEWQHPEVAQCVYRAEQARLSRSFSGHHSGSAVTPAAAAMLDNQGSSSKHKTSQMVGGAAGPGRAAASVIEHTKPGNDCGHSPGVNVTDDHAIYVNLLTSKMEHGGEGQILEHSTHLSGSEQQSPTCMGMGSSPPSFAPSSTTNHIAVSRARMHSVPTYQSRYQHDDSAMITSIRPRANSSPYTRIMQNNRRRETDVDTAIATAALGTSMAATPVRHCRPSRKADYVNRKSYHADMNSLPATLPARQEVIGAADDLHTGQTITYHRQNTSPLHGNTNISSDLPQTRTNSVDSLNTQNNYSVAPTASKTTIPRPTPAPRKNFSDFTSIYNASQPMEREHPDSP